MDWLQVSLETTDPDTIEDQLLELGAVSVTVTDAADQPLLEPAPGETPVWDHAMVTGLFPGNTAPQPIFQALGEANCKLELLEDRDWIRAWMDRYEPMRFGQRLWICPHHMRVDNPGAVVVRLDPGLAFGTGTHPTTALCLEWLDKTELAGSHVIDYGCGSGILAIAAALLGAEQVSAVDIDPQAISSTRDNANRNQVDDQILTGSPEVILDEQADVLMANILAGPLISLAPVLAKSLKPGGKLVLAGLLEDQQRPVMDAYTRHIDWDKPVTREGWTRLSGVKKPA